MREKCSFNSFPERRDSVKTFVSSVSILTLPKAARHYQLHSPQLLDNTLMTWKALISRRYDRCWHLWIHTLRRIHIDLRQLLSLKAFIIGRDDKWLPSKNVCIKGIAWDVDSVLDLNTLISFNTSSYDFHFFPTTFMQLCKLAIDEINRVLAHTCTYSIWHPLNEINRVLAHTYSDTL